MAEPRSVRLVPVPVVAFDAVVIVLFAEATYDVVQAVELPVDAVRESSRLVRHVNGHRLHATAAVLGHPAAVDVTDRIREALDSLGEHRVD